jgi:NAD-dependent SIR2 family protein deacetylase
LDYESADVRIPDFRKKKKNWNLKKNYKKFWK